MELKDWIGKRIFVRTKHDKVFNGEVYGVDETFFELIDKFGKHVVLAVGEIVEIKEEEKKWN